MSKVASPPLAVKGVLAIHPDPDGSGESRTSLVMRAQLVDGSVVSIMASGDTDLASMRRALADVEDLAARAALEKYIERVEAAGGAVAGARSASLQRVAVRIRDAFGRRHA